MNKLFSIYSTKNPEKWSLTLKAGIPFLLLVTNFFGFVVPEALVGALIDQGLILVSGLFAFYGLVRRLINVIQAGNEGMGEA